MKRPQPKVLDSTYIIKVNGTVTSTSNSLSEARRQVKQIPLTEDIEEVSITRRTLTETVLNRFKPEIKRALTVDDFFDD